MIPLLLLLFVSGYCDCQSISQCPDGDLSCVSSESGPSVAEDIPTLPRRDPGKVGDVVEEVYDDGRKQTLITRAIHPPIFELQDFLSSEECDMMITLAKTKGMGSAAMFGSGGSFTKASGRTGQTAFIPGKQYQLLRTIQDRAIKLTGLPKDLVYNNEDFQFGLYDIGGFYHFHYDSFPTSREELMSKPCCQHAQRPHTSVKCVVCRYVTILMYLNDVEEGGETAFPLADKPGHNVTSDHANLEANCKNSPVVVAPKKGNAVMWYNNIIDPEHGWLGVIDSCSLHGGCPILKGRKWISNLWINAPQFHSKNQKTIYHDEL